MNMPSTWAAGSLPTFRPSVHQVHRGHAVPFLPPSATLDDLSALERFVVAPRAKAEIFPACTTRHSPRSCATSSGTALQPTRRLTTLSTRFSSWRNATPRTPFRVSSRQPVFSCTSPARKLRLCIHSSGTAWRTRPLSHKQLGTRSSPRWSAAHHGRLAEQTREPALDPARRTPAVLLAPCARARRADRVAAIRPLGRVVHRHRVSPALPIDTSARTQCTAEERNAHLRRQLHRDIAHRRAAGDGGVSCCASQMASLWSAPPMRSRILSRTSPSHAAR
ncbi:hypothetical protein B0H13DRAFT_1089486 [Mycena leptocephala]|nr:hypothetical protein B0H13DRAFT_1089486 [Mycena leptocephala]